MKKSVLTFLVFTFFLSTSFAGNGYHLKVTSTNNDIVEIENLCGVVFQGTTNLCSFEFLKSESGTYHCGSSYVDVEISDGSITASLQTTEGSLKNISIDNDLCTFNVKPETLKYQNSQVSISGSIFSKYGKHATSLCALDNKIFSMYETNAEPFDCGTIEDDKIQEDIQAKVYAYRKNLPDHSFDIILKGALFYKSGGKLCDIQDKSIPAK